MKRSAVKRVLNRKLAGYHFSKLVAGAQVPKIRFHDLRHTFASWYMIEVGDIWSLKGILGHVDVQTTQRYAHLSDRHQKMPGLLVDSRWREILLRRFLASMGFTNHQLSSIY